MTVQPSRLTKHLTELRAAGRKALVAYVTASDPDVEQSVAVAVAAIDAGADVLEIGVPFSDPVADGPVIQRAMLRALAQGGGFAQALQVAQQVRAQRSAPLVLFGYLNPLLWLGLDESYRRARAAGIDAVLVVDAPHDEAPEVHAGARAAGLDTIPIVAPTTDPARVRAIAREAGGFVYVVSMTGVTGGQLDTFDHLAPMVATVREATRLSVCIGFGIRDAAAAARAAAVCDGVIVGSAIVEAVERGTVSGDVTAQVGRVVRELRAGVDTVRVGGSS
ncbi:MAG: tryptophan synthase subunit alpha [Myxococcota bacterium]